MSLKEMVREHVGWIHRSQYEDWRGAHGVEPSRFTKRGEFLD